MTAKKAPWSALRERTGHDGPEEPGTPMEFCSPIYTTDEHGHERQAAWATYASMLGATFYPPADETEATVAWDMPAIPKMKRALTHAETLLRASKRNPLLICIVNELKSYRDTGFSPTSDALPKRDAKTKTRRKKR